MHFPANSSLITYTGRWAAGYLSWWAGTGLTIQLSPNTTSLSLALGPQTSAPFAGIAVSVDHGSWVDYNATAGANSLKLEAPSDASRNVRIVTRGSADNRLELIGIDVDGTLEQDSTPPAPLHFEFIGDSLTAAWPLARGAVASWAFMAAETLGATHRMTAQPGAALTDIFSYGNLRGMSYQYYKTQDSGFYYNSTEPTMWADPDPSDVKAQRPKATHLTLLIGANDNSAGGRVDGTAVPAAEFQANLLAFLERLRFDFPGTPFFVMNGWGWPSANAPPAFWYPEVYPAVVEQRHAQGDEQIYLIDTEGWVNWDDVDHENLHPTDAGHVKISQLYLAWLKGWMARGQTT